MIKKTTTCLLSSVHRRTDILDFNYFYRNTDHNILVPCYLLKGTSETEGCPGTCPLLPHLPTFAHNQLLNQEPSAFNPGLYRLNYHHPTSVKKESNGDTKAPPCSLWGTVTIAPWKESIRVHHSNTPNNEALHMVGWWKGASHSVREEHVVTVIHICI